ncbi:hypothetical protein HMPREF2625_09230 [Rothia sp. HMSC064D08]|nr:hypothetical protein HMPREF2625_09230 [Rothia sp. HMSC064D08]
MLSIPAASSFVLGPSKSVQERVAPGAPIYISSLDRPIGTQSSIIIFRIFHAGNSAVFSPRNASLLHELSVRWQSMKYGHMLRDDTFPRYIGHLETHLA